MNRAWRYRILLCFLPWALAAPSAAQDLREPYREEPVRRVLPRSAATGSHIDLGLGFSSVPVKFPGSPAAQLFGFASNVTLDLLPRISLRLDAGFVRAADIARTGHRGDLGSILLGPVVYPWRRPTISPYFHVLAGAARVRGPITLSGVSGTAYVGRPAWAAGGGLEAPISSSVAVRIEVDVLRTQFFSATGRIEGQSNLRLTTGLVYHFNRYSRRDRRRVD